MSSIPQSPSGSMLEGGVVFAVSPAAPNTLRVPREVREYINEHGEGRSFNLESFHVRHETQPGHIEVELEITKKGAEMLEPFVVRLFLADPAAKQLSQALDSSMADSEQ